MDESKIYRYVTSPTDHTYVVFGLRFPNGYAEFHSLKRAQLYAPADAQLEIIVRHGEVEPWIRDSALYCDGYALGARHAERGFPYALPFGKHVNYVAGYKAGYDS